MAIDRAPRETRYLGQINTVVTFAYIAGASRRHSTAKLESMRWHHLCLVGLARLIGTNENTVDRVAISAFEVPTGRTVDAFIPYQDARTRDGERLSASQSGAGCALTMEARDATENE
jgi:hypothetical protein